MNDNINRSILAGILIAFAGALYINCPDKIVGSFLFSLGLISVVMLKANLFTGKVGYIANHIDFVNAEITLISNLVSAYAFGLIYNLFIGTNTLWVNTLNKGIRELFFGSIICGICIYLAVELYSRFKSLIVLILPVMAFILGGGFHVVACAFYAGAAGVADIKSLCYILVITLGNSLGSILVRRLQLLY